MLSNSSFRLRPSLVVVGLAILFSASLGAADAFTVNSVGDDSDASIASPACDTGNLLLDKSAECTLRAAIEQANALTGPHTISFDISSDQCTAGICVINVVTAGGNTLPNVVREVTIDGSTQPGNAAVCTSAIVDRPSYAIVVDGDGVDVGLRFGTGSAGSVVRGLNVRNFFNGIVFEEVDNVTAECNFVGTDETGMSAIPNVQNGFILVCDSSGNTIGGPDPEDANLSSGNGVDGIQIFTGIPCSSKVPQPPTNTLIEGNLIGLAKDGATALGNAFSGISAFGGPGSTGNTIRNNVIGGNFGGIFLEAASTSNTIVGNRIGTDTSGANPVANEIGIEINGGPNQIGGPTPADANTIAFNSLEGVLIWTPAGTATSSTRVQQNSIHDNGELGIDLSVLPDSFIPDGVTPNDPGDADSGANELQNFPEFTAATLVGPNLALDYGVPSSADFPMTIEFFLADADGLEGQTFIGSQTYAAAGPATANLMGTGASVGDQVVATTTNANNSTSEFSAPITIQAGGVPPLFSKTFMADAIGLGGISTLTFTIDNSANAIAATALDFTDSLPAGLLIASPSNASNTCVDGTLTAVPGSGSVSYTGGSIAAGSVCTVSVDVTATSIGAHVNVSGDLTSSLGNSGTASATLSVFEAPVFSKAFGASVATIGDLVLLEFTIDNTGSAVAATDLSFVDNLPAGMTVASPANASTTCTGGTLTATGGSTQVSYSGGSVAAGSLCTIQVDVLVLEQGVLSNVTEVLTSNLGDSGTASADVAVQSTLAIPVSSPWGHAALVIALALAALWIRRSHSP